MEVLAGLFFFPLFLVVGICILICLTAKNATTARSKVVKNQVGCSTMNEIAEAKKEGREVNQKKIVSYDLQWISYRDSLNKFLNQQYKNDGLLQWVARQPENFLLENYHCIKLHFKNGTIKDIVVICISSIGQPSFKIQNLSDIKKDNDKKDDDEQSDDKKEDEIKSEPNPKKKTTSDSVKESAEVKWVKNNLSYLTKQKENCIKNDEDFFIIDKEHSPNKNIDLLKISEELTKYSLLLGREDDVLTISI